MVAGPHAGAVAGCVDADGRVRYVYPEITGYFLHWLAWQAAARTEAASGAELRRRAGAAQGWLVRWITADAPPPTRIHLAPSDADWRNEAVFCFDIAMVLRGLAAAARERLLEPDPALIAGLVAQLRTLVGADGAFDAYVPRERGTVLPDRWSTRRGGFLAKAAAGVIVAAGTLRGIPPDLVAAAEATFDDSLHAAVDAPHDEVHPLLYTFEGILDLPEHPRFAAMLPPLATQMNALLRSRAKRAGCRKSSRRRRHPPGARGSMCWRRRFAPAIGSSGIGRTTRRTASVSPGCGTRSSTGSSRTAQFRFRRERRLRSTMSGRRCSPSRRCGSPSRAASGSLAWTSLSI